MRENSEPELIKEIIPKSIKALGNDFVEQYIRRYALFHWKKIVGDSVAANVEVVGIEYKILTLYAHNQYWKQNIFMYKENIIQKVNNMAGKKIIDDIRFVPFQRKHEIITESLTEREKTETEPNRTFISENLSDEETNRIKTMCEQVENRDMKRMFLAIIMAGHKKHKAKEKIGWTPCAYCGDLCPKEDKLCRDCQVLEKAEVRRRIRQILTTKPWATYGEIKRAVNVSPRAVKLERSLLIQKRAAEIKLDEWNSDKARNLVMLYKCLPPAQLNDDIVRETIYRLRFDLAKSEEFTPVKRYDYVARGKKRNGKRKYAGQ